MRLEREETIWSAWSLLHCVFVAIDPGQQTGWSIWSVNGLVACGLGDPRQHGQHVVTSESEIDVINEAWIERPVIYPRSKARPNDIISLALNAGQWAGIYNCLGCDFHYVEPAQWKGQVPKDIHHSRIWSTLTAKDQEAVNRAFKKTAVAKRHNIMDAVGLGLWVRASHYQTWAK